MSGYLGKMGNAKKKLSQVLQAIDPNLNIVSSHKKKRRTSRADWEKLAGVNCPYCGEEILKTCGPFKQCNKCFNREKGIFLEGTECPKCKQRAAKVTTLSNGLQGEKIIRPRCGTFSI